MIVLLIYVDDIIVTGSCSATISSLVAYLRTKFAVKELGNLHYFPGIEVSRSANDLHLSQAKYNSKSLATSIALGTLSLHNGEPLTDPIEYRSLIEALQYCTLTMLDLSFAVNKLCQFIHSPTTIHMQAIKKVLRYLRGTAHLGFFLQPSLDHTLYADTDADWASCPNDR
ncbi:uncharacterized mitochondrial protein AtMg00810-like [Humulus lupulus]|uniref:uncharacterized mitochondrial protein AtMg00810-like n=1 Tax=Humulus lupulus TaxID=3486 RepID=UPI002B405AFF|nr:uncharacterized mitochondrial protein AtMg00810-like [Humulus lupulus]